LLIVGDDVVELAVDCGIEIGIAIGSLEPLALLIGEFVG